MDKSVLIVEDETLIREMLREVFDSIYRDVYTADCGESGLIQFKQSAPDLIITDIKMRKMDGLTMIEKIKEIDEKQKFIIITAYSDEEHQQKAKELGIDNLLIKPIDLRNLIELSRDLLKYA